MSKIDVKYQYIGNIIGMEYRSCKLDANIKCPRGCYCNQCNIPIIAAIKGELEK